MFYGQGARRAKSESFSSTHEWPRIRLRVPTWCKTYGARTTDYSNNSGRGQGSTYQRACTPIERHRFLLTLSEPTKDFRKEVLEASIVTEQGNPGIYIQIDEWLPLYKGNVFVVNEVTGRMYWLKGEHLMRIAETVSHCPFKHHELSVSCHIPDREKGKEKKIF